MAEDDGDSQRADANTAAADGIALAGASRARADAYLGEQLRLTRLQSDSLIEQNAFELNHLRWRRFNDQMKGALQMILVAAVLLVAAAIAAALWSAAHDDSLVIEAFSVPPDLASRGLTGQAVAAQLQDQLAAMQDATNSSRPAKSYANSWDDGIKVIIPDTGISVGDLYRTLAGWLGHQTRITGEVYRTPAGLAVTARSTVTGGFTVSGSEAQFGALLQQSAEAIYHRTQPYRYAVYLAGNGQVPRAMPLYLDLANNGDRDDRIWAHMGISDILELARPFDALAENRKALAIDPDFILAYQNIAGEETVFGHPEAALAALRKSLSLFAKVPEQMSARARAISLLGARGNLAFLLGDCHGAIAQYAAAAVLPDYSSEAEYDRVQVANCLSLLHEDAAAREAWAVIPLPGVSFDVSFYYPAKIESDAAAGDWQAVLADRAAAQAGFDALDAKIPPIKAGFDVEMSRQLQPFAALAEAKRGDIAGAQALIAATSLDCYLCLRMRGRIAVLARDGRGGAGWFARAAALAPSIPLADADWGTALLAKGDTAGAIAHFQAASRLGPHFADPLEMWGEALIAQNRSDLALAKFADAARYAPNWGRLHLKWGEALLWLGRKDDAKTQFARAAVLDLSAQDARILKALLAKV